MSYPFFPTLTAKLTDPSWFNVDQPCDEEAELTAMEEDLANWYHQLTTLNENLIPIGKTAAELQVMEDEDDDDDEDDNDDDEESETHDEEDEDEIEIDAPYDPNSTVGVNANNISAGEEVQE